MAKECPKCEDGLPPWLATFADLMSLLMCFFVLLLSFAEVDATRFKKMAEAMKDAFGVQREVPVMDVVMGTSVIKQEFSPSTISEPSPIDQIKQQTTDQEKEQLDVPDKKKTELQETMEQLQEKLQQMEKVIEDQREQLEQADPQKLAELEQAIKELKEQLEKAQQELQAKIDELLEKIAAMEKVIDELRKALEQSVEPEKLAELEKAMQELKAELQKLEKEPKQDKSEQEKLEEEALAAQARKRQEEIQQEAQELKQILNKEIAEGLITVETAESKIIIRIQEKGSFPSGSADFNPGFLDVVDRISDALVRSPGRIIVAGHTDNVPIYTSRFRSNWELSSARAVTVVHALLMNPGIADDRVLIEGYADSHPLVPNDSPENRAKNRRVELIIVRGDDGEKKEVMGVGQ